MPKHALQTYGSMLAGAMIAAALFIVTGCDDSVPPFRDALAIVFTDDSDVAFTDGGNIFLSAGTITPKRFQAPPVIEGKTVSYAGIVIAGDDVVQVSVSESGTMNITPVKRGDAKIRVQAVTPDDSTEAEFNVYVNPSGYGPWTFKILDGLTEIHDNGTLGIPLNGNKIIDLKAAAETAIADADVAFAWAVAEGDSVQLQRGIGNTAANISIVKNDKAAISVTAVKGAETITKTFTVHAVDSSFIFSLDCAAWREANPGVSSLGQAPYYSGNGVYFGARNEAPVSVTADGFKLGGSNEVSRLSIGTGTAASSGNFFGSSNSTSLSNRHIPGQFDLSQGIFRLTVDYDTPSTGNGATLLRVTINNNTTSPDNSVLRSNSTVYSFANPNNLINGIVTPKAGLSGLGERGRISLTFTPSILYTDAVWQVPVNGKQAQGKESLKTAAITLFVWPTESLTIKSIRLERVDK